MYPPNDVLSDLAGYVHRFIELLALRLDEVNREEQSYVVLDLVEFQRLSEFNEELKPRLAAAVARIAMERLTHHQSPGCPTSPCMSPVADIETPPEEPTITEFRIGWTIAANDISKLLERCHNDVAQNEPYVVLERAEIEQLLNSSNALRLLTCSVRARYAAMQQIADADEKLEAGTPGSLKLLNDDADLPPSKYNF